MYSVQDLFEKQGKELALTLIAGKAGLRLPIKHVEVKRLGLALTGHLSANTAKRVLVLGKAETSFLKELGAALSQERLRAILLCEIPAVIVTRNLSPPAELVQMCEEFHIPLFKTPFSTVRFLTQINFLFLGLFAKNTTCHGTLVEVFGVGVLIQGDSSVGKSEAALGLIDRGHRLISDDLVRIRVKDGYHLEGSGPELTRHHMEIRGIGIINVAHLYGIDCVRDTKNIDLVVNLENWAEESSYDRVGLEEKYCEFLEIKVPHHVLPVKPGRDVVLLLETIALNFRLKVMGYDSVKEFRVKLIDAIAKKERKNVRKSPKEAVLL